MTEICGRRTALLPNFLCVLPEHDDERHYMQRKIRVERNETLGWRVDCAQHPHLGHASFHDFQHAITYARNHLTYAHSECDE
jgi:hypothetical protein